MKLRSGFQTGSKTAVVEETLYCCPKALLCQIYLLDDIETHHYHDWFLAKVGQTRGNLNYIEEYSREKLLSMDVIWLKDVYVNCVEIVKRIIVASYKHDSFSNKTNQEFIRILYAANKLQKKLGTILWTLRTDERVFHILSNESTGESLYRCLRHIISDECIAYDYQIESYNMGDYSDVELWDYWFAPNCLIPESEDLFVKQAKHCLEAQIRFWNIRTITM